MIGRDFSDIYVAACGQTFDTRRQGVMHEKECPWCREDEEDDEE